MITVMRMTLTLNEGDDGINKHNIYEDYDGIIKHNIYEHY